MTENKNSSREISRIPTCTLNHFLRFISHPEMFVQMVQWHRKKKVKVKPVLKPRTGNRNQSLINHGDWAKQTGRSKERSRSEWNLINRSQELRWKTYVSGSEAGIEKQVFKYTHPAPPYLKAQHFAKQLTPFLQPIYDYFPSFFTQCRQENTFHSMVFNLISLPCASHCSLSFYTFHSQLSWIL